MFKLPSKPLPPPPAKPSTPAAPPPKPVTTQARTPSSPAQKFASEFSSGRGSALRARARSVIGGSAPVIPTRTFATGQVSGTARSSATTLLNESIGDGRSNCLEQAYTACRPNDSVTLLQDSRDPTGHAVVERQDGTVFDPANQQRHASMEAYLVANPHYALRPEPQARGIPRASLERVFNTPPRSLQRSLVLSSTGLASIGNVRVADVTPPTRETQAVNAALATYNEANQARIDADEQLAKELARLGPSLSEAERQQYINAFRADPAYAGAYEGESAAAQQLEAALLANQGAIEAYAATTSNTWTRPDTEYAGFGVLAVCEGYAALAQSSRPQAAIDFASNALTNRDSQFHYAQDIVSKIGFSVPNLQDEVLAPAIAAAVPAYLAAHPSATIDEALADTQARLGEAANLQVAGSNGLTVRDALASMRLVAAGDPVALASMRSFATGPLGSALAVMGLGIALLNGHNSAEQNDAVGVLTSALVATREGATALNGLVTAYNRMTTGITAGSPLLGRIAMGANALVALFDMANTLGNGGGLNAGDQLNLGANAVTIAASLAALTFPVTAPVAVPLAAVASLFALGGSLLSGILDARELRAEVEGHLRDAGITHPEGRFTLGAHPGQAVLLTTPPPAGFGLDHEQAAQLAEEDFGVFLGVSPSALAFAGPRAQGFLLALANSPYPYDAVMVGQLMDILEGGGNLSGPQWQDYLRQERERVMYGGNPLGHAVALAATFAPQ